MFMSGGYATIGVGGTERIVQELTPRSRRRVIAKRHKWIQIKIARFLICQAVNSDSAWDDEEIGVFVGITKLGPTSQVLMERPMV